MRASRHVIRVTILGLIGWAWLAAGYQADAATSAQSPRKISGVVTDQSGARLINATVTIKSKAFERTVQVDDTGEFELEAPPGRYELHIKAPDFFPVAVTSLGWMGPSRPMIIAMKLQTEIACVLRITEEEPLLAEDAPMVALNNPSPKMDPEAGGQKPNKKRVKRH